MSISPGDLISIKEVNAGTGTGTPTINCWSGVATGAITTSALPTLNNRTVNATIYNIMNDGSNCYITWASGFP